MVRIGQAWGRGVVLLALALGPAPVAAQLRPFVSISPTSTTVNPGANVVVDLGYGRALTMPPPTIVQLTGSVSWDASALTLVSAVPQGGIDFRSCAISAGRLDFDFAENLCSPPVAFPSGPLCRLTFAAASTQATRAARPLSITLTSCNDEGRFVICDSQGVLRIPPLKVERSCDRINGSITVNQAQYVSTPAPGARITLAAPIGGSASAFLEVRNDGSFATAISFSGLAAPVSASPASFALAAAQTQMVELRCQPTLPGTVERVLTTAIGNDPDRSTASYTVACSAILPPERDVVNVSRQGNAGSLAPVYDASGRYLVFQSAASNLLAGNPPPPDSNNASDIFRLDTETGAVLRISVDDAEAPMAGGSIEPSVAANGLAVAFVAPAAAARVLRGETKSAREQRLKAGGFAILLRNIQTGTTQAVGSGLAGGVGTQPIIAPGGGAIAYTATNADPLQGAPGQDNVYVVTLQRLLDGNLQPAEPVCVSCASRDAAGTPVGFAAGASGAPVLSADGLVVAFETLAKNLLANAPTPCPNAAREVVLRNLQTGVTRRVSPPPGLPPSACGTLGSGKPSIDHSGRMIAFESDQGINAGHAAGMPNVYVSDVLNTQFQRVSEAGDGSAANAAALQPAISGDGRSVAFVSAAGNLDPSLGATDGLAYVHARRLDGVLAQRLSLSTLGVQANAPMARPALSYAGTRVTFDSAASNLVLDDLNGVDDVFQRPLPVNVDVLYYAGFE